jgi:phosphatidylethanolamine/phosphatidyl-N-methylethanolamine N-methyltransferase
VVARIREAAAFLGSALRSPSRVGALAPSSRALARTMTRAMGRFEQVVELGAGTGRITRALLDGLSAEGHLLALEIDSVLREGLAERLDDPRLQLTGESAEHLVRALGSRRVPRIVSGLPFQSLGRLVSHRILASARRSLTPDGRFVAFQYGSGALPLFRAHFRRVKVIGPVWGNLPPALIFICRP